jgi:putative transcriptional regulator
MSSTARRRLLVANPTLVDPNFFRSVVFMIEHNADGAIGVVLNRPTDAELVEAVPEWASIAAPPSVAFVGGPVQPDDAVIGLGRVARVDGMEAEAELAGWQPLIGRIGTLDLGRSPVDVRVEVEAVRVFAGYSGWGPGQLDEELAHGGWFVVDAEADDLLTRDPSRLWRAVLRRQGGDLAVAANFPIDIQSN